MWLKHDYQNEAKNINDINTGGIIGFKISDPATHDLAAVTLKRRPLSMGFILEIYPSSHAALDRVMNNFRSRPFYTSIGVAQHPIRIEFTSPDKKVIATAINKLIAAYPDFKPSALELCSESHIDLMSGYDEIPQWILVSFYNSKFTYLNTENERHNTVTFSMQGHTLTMHLEFKNGDRPSIRSITQFMPEDLFEVQSFLDDMNISTNREMLNSILFAVVELIHRARIVTPSSATQHMSRVAPSTNVAPGVATPQSHDESGKNSMSVKK